MSFPIYAAALPPLNLELKVLAGQKKTFAVRKGQIIKIRLRYDRRLSCASPRLSLFLDERSSAAKQATFMWERTFGSADQYVCCIKTHDLAVGLYFFEISLDTPDGTYYANRRDGGCFWHNEASHRPFQLTIYDRLHSPILWLEGGIIYHIFVDRFARGTKTIPADNAPFNPDWDNGKVEYPAYPGAPYANNTHFGGNLSGIIRRLPYLQSLGVTCLYLSPIGKSASNHKYDTGDYLSVDPSFGDMKMLKRLIRKARDLGIGIILDGVFNHTGDNSIYFNRYGQYPSCGAYQSKKSPYYDWYGFKDHPDSYHCWWDIPILPKLNLQNSSCRQFFIGPGGVVDTYAAMGISGMRLDVADELDDAFIAAIKDRLVEHKSDAVLYGEVWEDASNKIAYDTRKSYYLGNELDGVMNYPLRRGIIDFVKHGETSALNYALNSVMMNAPPEVRAVQMNLLGTHDTERIISALGQISFEGKSNDQISTMRMGPAEYRQAKQRLKIAYLICSTLPGVPSIYYGDEVGMEGYKDPFNRHPFPWKAMDTDLLETYRQIGCLRRHKRVYHNGEFALHELNPSLLLFSRNMGRKRYFTLVNRGDSPVRIFANAPVRFHFCTESSSEADVLVPLQGAVFSTTADKIRIKTIR